MFVDDRVHSSSLVSEKALRTPTHRKQVKVLQRSQLRKRWAADILADFGPAVCPSNMAIGGRLFKEAREALGWTRAETAWKLGYETRSGTPIKDIEEYRRFPRRFVRILMMQALEKLVVKQGEVFARAPRVRGMRERQ